MEREHTLPSFQEEDDPYALLWPGLNTAPIRAKIRAYVSGVNLPGWREQADDIAHDIFQEAVIRASQETRPIQNISAYLTRVAYHYFVDLYRQAKSELRLVETIGQTQLRDEETSFELQMQALMDSSNNFRDYGFILDEETCILYMILLDYGLDHYDEVIVDDEFSCYALSFPRAQLGYVRDAVTRIYQGEPLISEQTYRQKQREYNSELVRTFGQALPEPCQSILRLYYLEQCTLGEIVNHVQLPLGTVKSHINRGVRELHRLRDQAESQQHQEQEMNTQTEKAQQDEQAEIVTHIHALPERYQTAIRLHYMERRTYPEIARELDLPIGTVKSLVSRGMKLLRKQQEAA